MPVIPALRWQWHKITTIKQPSLHKDPASKKKKFNYRFRDRGVGYKDMKDVLSLKASFSD